MATLRSDGRYMARRTIAGQRRSFYGITDEEAESKADAAMGVALPSLTVRGFWNQNVFPQIILQSYATQEQARWAFDTYIGPAIGSKRPEDLTLGDFQRVLAIKKSAWTVRTVHKWLFRLGRLLARSREIPYNYAEETIVPGVGVTSAHLPLEMAQALLFASFDSWVYPAIVLGYALGLRRGEALGLKTRHVHEDGLIEIVSQRVPSEGEKASLKNKGSRRAFHVSKPLAAHLRDVADGAYIVRPCVPTSLRKPFMRVLEKAGLPDVPFHALRDSFSTNIRALGCPEYVAASIMGHSRKSQTDAYTHASADQQIEWTGKLWEASTYPWCQAGVNGLGEEVKIA